MKKKWWAALTLIAFFGIAAAVTALALPGTSKRVASSGAHWVSQAGAGLVAPACGSSSVGTSCSGPTPIATISWSADPSLSCSGGTASVTVNGSTVGSGSCSGSYGWSGGAMQTSYSYEVLTTDQNGASHSISTGSFTEPFCPDASTCRTTLAASPTTIDQGQSSTLSWSPNSTLCGYTSCTFLDGASFSGASGTRSVSPSSTTNYGITCSGPYGTTPASYAGVTVLVPTASIGVNPQRVVTGGSLTVTWSASNVNSCSITKNGTTWKSLTANASRALSGSATDSITTQTTYKIVCANNGSASAASATGLVDVTPGFQEF